MDERVTFVLGALEVRGRGHPADVAVDALGVDVVTSERVFGKLVPGIGQRRGR